MIIGLTAVFCLTTGIFQALFGVMVSVLLGLQTTKYHYWYLLATSVLILGVSALFFGFPVSLIIAVPYVLIGLALGFSFNLKLSSYKTVVICAVLFLAGMLVQIKFVEEFSATQTDLGELIMASANEIKQIFASVYGAEGELLSQIDELFNAMAQTLITLTPALFTIMSLALAYGALSLFKACARKDGADVTHFANFDQLRTDKILGILYLALVLLNLFAPAGYFADLSLNVLIILTFVFFVFGLSYLDFRMKIGGVKKGIRRVIVAALCIFPFVLFTLPFMLITGAGVMDSLMDFRKRSASKPQP